MSGGEGGEPRLERLHGRHPGHGGAQRPTELCDEVSEDNVHVYSWNNRLFCRRDCAVTEWSEWSEGPGGQVYCDTRGEGEQGESRTRSIISPAIGEGRPCPHLEETRPMSERRECKYR